MKLQSVKNKIDKMGGETAWKLRDYTGGGNEYYELVGTLNGWDIRMQPNGDEETNYYFRMRRTTDRDYWDPGSDYNQSGWTFCYKVKDLERIAGQKPDYVLADRKTGTIILEATHTSI